MRNEGKLIQIVIRKECICVRLFSEIKKISYFLLILILILSKELKIIIQINTYQINKILSLKKKNFHNANP